MKNNKILVLIIILFLSIFLYSCKDKEDNNTENENQTETDTTLLGYVNYEFFNYAINKTSSYDELAENVVKNHIERDEAISYMNANSSSITENTFIVYAYDSNYSILYHDSTNNNWNTYLDVTKDNLKNYFNNNTEVYYLTKTFKFPYTIKKATNINNVISNSNWIMSNANYYEDEIISYITTKYDGQNPTGTIIFWHYDPMDKIYSYLKYEDATESIPAGWHSYTGSESDIKTAYANYSSPLYYFYS